MRPIVVALALILAVPAISQAWNEKGHQAIARLAWLKLTPAERAACTQILQAHPHYQEYLIADKPAGVSEAEWAFMRAAYWPDWVRSNHSEQFNKPTWHYVTAAYVPPHSRLKAADLPSQEPNVVTQITASADQLRSGAAPDKAIYLCWLLHLVGDIHQPLHCASQLCERFPQGDQGGNLAIVRIAGGMPVRLHYAWDAMLGEDMGLEAILALVHELEQLGCAEAEQIGRDVRTRTTSAQWAAEGFASAEEFVYLKGDLRPGHVDEQAREELIPNLSDVYVQNAKQVSRRGAVKAACRLAKCISAALRP